MIEIKQKTGLMAWDFGRQKKTKKKKKDKCYSTEIRSNFLVAQCMQPQNDDRVHDVVYH